MPAPRASPSSSYGVARLVSSINSSTLSALPMQVCYRAHKSYACWQTSHDQQDGSIISVTAFGFSSKSSSCISCSPRHRDVRWRSLPSVRTPAARLSRPLICLFAVFEDKIQEQQQQRVEREMEEDSTPVVPGHNSIDKDKEDNAFHIETSTR